jgi:predicted AAA+ superfamily ATPase
MREFNTFGPCDPAHNYVVPRTADIADFVQRLKRGRYIVIFAPRQTGKTTFFLVFLKTVAKFKLDPSLRRDRLNGIEFLMRRSQRN